MKVEIEAQYNDGAVDVYVGTQHVVTLPSSYDPYRASEEEIVTAAVAEWLRGLEQARQS